ncbi:MAG: DUF1641 domain-containing protein [Desulfobaccales bacterium]
MNGEAELSERLARIEEKLDRVLAMEEKLQVFADWWENIHDLGRDLSLLTHPTVKMLTEELAEVETGFQSEDVFILLRRLLLNFRNLAWSLDQLENFIDWWRDLEPILKVAVPRLIDQLDQLEEAGLFRVLKNATSLEMIRFLDRLSRVPVEVDLAAARPVGPVGLMWRLRSPEARQGLGLVVELTKALGKVKGEA